MTRPVQPTNDPTPEPPAPRYEEGRTHSYGDGCDPPHERPPVQTVTVVVELPAPLFAVADLLKVVGQHWPTAAVDTADPRGWRITLHCPASRWDERVYEADARKERMG